MAFEIPRSLQYLCYFSLLRHMLCVTTMIRKLYIYNYMIIIYSWTYDRLRWYSQKDALADLVMDFRLILLVRCVHCLFGAFGWKIHEPTPPHDTVENLR